MKKQIMLDKQDKPYHIDSHRDSVTFITSIKADRLPPTLKQPLRVNLDNLPVQQAGDFALHQQRVLTNKVRALLKTQLT